MGCNMNLATRKTCTIKAYHYVIPSTFAVTTPMIITAKPCLPHLGFLSNVSSPATTPGIICLMREPCPCSNGFFYDSLVPSSKDKTANDNGG